MSLDSNKTDWKHVAFGDVVHRSRVQATQADGSIDRYVAGGHFDAESMTVTRFGTPDDGGMGSTFTYKFEPGQVLFVSASWYLKKAAVATFEGVVADKTYVLEPKDEAVLHPDFLPWILVSDALRDYARGAASGSMNARLLWGALSAYEFDLPTLDEQKRIADLLWATESHRVALATLRDRHQDAFQASLDRNFLMQTGERLPIGLVASVSHGFAFPGSGFSDDPDCPTVLTPKNFAIGGGFQEVAVKTFAGTVNDDFVLTPGDIVVTMTDLSKSGDTLGYSAEVPGGRTYLHNQRIGKVVMKDGAGVLAEFLMWVMRTRDYRAHILRTAAGSTVRHTSPTKIEQYEFTVPSEDQQRAACSKIRAIAAAQDDVRSEEEAVCAVRASVLADIFGSST